MSVQLVEMARRFTWLSGDVKVLRSASRHPESQIHRAADAHLNAMKLALLASFNIGRKALGNPPNADRAAAAVKSALLKALPPVLVSCFAAGGNAGVELLLKRVKSVVK